MSFRKDENNSAIKPIGTMNNWTILLNPLDMCPIQIWYIVYDENSCARAKCTSLNLSREMIRLSIFLHMSLKLKLPRIDFRTQQVGSLNRAVRRVEEPGASLLPLIYVDEGQRLVPRKRETATVLGTTITFIRDDDDDDCSRFANLSLDVRINGIKLTARSNVAWFAKGA